jgi:RNA polymerase sigma factor (sigma-70 family)
LEEPELVKRCQQTDRKAQELLYARFADRMFRVGFRYVKSEMETEDVIIVAFGNAFKSIRSFKYRGPGSLEAWLRKIVINESLMWLRKRHNFNLTETIDERVPEASLKQFSESGADDIYKMITQLPTGYRTVFNLNVIEGYSHEEIGTLLGISEGTSRSQLFKAKALLKKMLTREGFHYGT